jgi:hypothetical protein
MRNRLSARHLLLSILLLIQSLASTSRAAVTDAEVRELLGPPVQIEQLRSHGPAVLPVMAALYPS